MSSTPEHRNSNQGYNAFLFHQMNVGKGGTNTEIALQQAWEAGAHIVMIQEPWTMYKDGKQITKNHPGFNSHIPSSRSKARPRAVTFTREGFQATQFLPPGLDHSADYCFVTMSNITFVNVYRAPGHSGSLEPLLMWKPDKHSVVGGDFNTVSRHWQPQASRQYGYRDQIIEWATAHNLSLVSTAGEATHHDGNFLDLVWSNIPAVAAVSEDFDCTSDHRTTVGSAQFSRRNIQPRITQLRVSDKNLENFSQYVKAWAKPGPLNSISEIESQTSRLLEAIKDADKAVGSIPAEKTGGTAPWWDQDCKIKHRIYKDAKRSQATTSQARKDFRSVLKKAKREYWRKQVESCTTDDAIFRLMK